MSARILVVDDEQDVKELIKRRFRREIRGGEIDFKFAADGVDALSLLESDGEVDIVLCDINMPRMDGLTLLGRLKEKTSLMKTVMVSAYGDMVNIRAAMNRGAFDFVTKPIDFEDLKVTISKTLKDLEILQDALQRRAAAEQARANLSRYFSPRLAEELARRDQPLGPVRRQKVAVLCADIVGFTRISENQTPEQTMALLRDYHGRMEAEVFAHNGVMEKFIGDALLATFGVPEPGGRDAVDALTCARAMLEGLARWNGERAERGEQPVRIGVGLNYGPAVLGDIGSERNMAFAVIGDTTNTASRLEGLTRDLSCDIVASEAFVEATREQGGEEAETLLTGFRLGDYQALKGRENKVLVWTFASARL